MHACNECHTTQLNSERTPAPVPRHTTRNNILRMVPSSPSTEKRITILLARNTIRRRKRVALHGSVARSGSSTQASHRHLLLAQHSLPLVFKPLLDHPFEREHAFDPLLLPRQPRFPAQVARARHRAVRVEARVLVQGDQTARVRGAEDVPAVPAVVAADEEVEVCAADRGVAGGGLGVGLSDGRER